LTWDADVAPYLDIWFDNGAHAGQPVQWHVEVRLG